MCCCARTAPLHMIDLNAYVVALTVSEALTKSRADDMLDALAEHGAAMSVGVAESCVTLTVDAENLTAAAGRAVALVDEHADVAALHAETERARNLREFGETPT